MEVELSQDVVDRLGSFPLPVGPVECVPRNFHRQRLDIEGLAVMGIREVTQRQMLSARVSSSTTL